MEATGIRGGLSKLARNVISIVVSITLAFALTPVMSHTAYASDVDDCEHEDIYCIEASDATCIYEGVSIVDESGNYLEEVYYCQDCEQYFTDEDATEVISVTVTYTDSLGHSADNVGTTLIAVEDDDLTFYDAGDEVVTSTVYQCSDCNRYYIIVTDEDTGEAWVVRVYTDNEDEFDDEDEDYNSHLPSFEDAESAIALSLDSATAAEIGTAGDYVWYSFTPSVSQIYSFVAESDSGEMTILLYDAEGNEIDYNSSMWPALSDSLDAGCAYYIAFGFDDADLTGSFTALVSVFSDSGECGTNCVWDINSDGTLTIAVADGYDSGNLAQVEYSSTYYDDDDEEVSYTYTEWPWNAYYHLITKVSFEGTVVAPADMSYFFGDYMPNITEIEGLDNLDISSVTNMDGLFASCENLTSLDLSSWDTSSVTTMERVFAWCHSLTSVDLSAWDTSSVVEMGYMFQACSSLEYVNISSFVIPSGFYTANDDDGSEYTTYYAENMFKYCSALRTVVLPESFFTICDDDGDVICGLPIPESDEYGEGAWTDGQSIHGAGEVPDGAGTYVAVFDTNGDGVIDDSDENDTSGLNSGSSSGSSKTTDTSVSLSSAKVTLGTTNYTYDGSAKKPSVTVTLDGTTLTSGTDYTVSYSNNTNAGTATVTVTGSGNYTDTASTTFTINKASLSSAKVTLKTTSYTYNGKTKKPGISSVKVGNTTISSSGYTVSYKNNKNAGTATVTVTGTGNYTGSAKATFTIKQATQKLTVKKSTKTVKYSKVKKKKQTVKAITKVSGAKGKKTYSLTSAKKGSKSYKSKFSVNKSTGKITVKKGTKKGTYKVKVKVTSAKTTNYKKATKTVTVTIKVK